MQEHVRGLGADLLAVAAPHLEWLSAALDTCPHAVALLDAAGVVRRATGNDGGMLDAVARLARECAEGHSRRSAGPVTALGAVIHGHDGVVVGSVVLAMDAALATGERACLLAHVAYAVERELGRLAAERARVADARQASATLAALIETVPLPVVSLDRAGRVSIWNPAAARLFGRSAAETVGQSLSNGVPDGLDELQADLMAAIEGRMATGREIRRRTLTGVVLDLSVWTAALRDEHGRAEGAVAVIADVTAGRQAAETMRFLAEAGTLLAASLEYSATVASITRLSVPHLADYCVIDVLEDDGRIRRVASAHWNPAKEALVRELRRHPPDPLGDSSVAKVLRTGLPTIAADVSHTLERAASPDADLLAVHAALGLRSWMAVPLIARGRLIGAMGFGAAESGRRYGEADLTLAADVAHRAALAIDNARLYRDLQEADRRKDQFLAMLAHELRNPLAPIVNAVHVLERLSSPEPRTARLRAIIGRQARHLARLVDDLLDVARIRSGKIELRRQPVDLRDVLSRSLESLRESGRAERRELVVMVPREPVIVDADDVRLEQVLDNLLDNAVKYTEPGAVIRVAVEHAEGHGVVRVVDHGIGIAPEILPHIFEAFTQADASLARSRGGLGLGLTLVRSLVEQHGGAVTATSAGIGAGSEFVVRLPLESRAMRARSAVTPPALCAAPPPRRASEERAS